MNSAKTLRTATGMDLTLLALMVMMWAGAFSAIRVVAHHTGPIWLAADRVFIGFLFLAAASVFLPALRVNLKMPWGRLFFIAILNVSIPFSLISWAELSISASMTSLLMGAGPFMALGIMHVFTQDERLNRLKIVAAVVGFSGVLIAIGPDAITGDGDISFLPVVAVLGASLSYIISGLLVKRTAMNPMAMATGTLLIGSVQLIPAVFIFTGPHPTGLETQTTLALFFLGLCPTGIAYILRYHLIQNVGYSLVVMGINALPVMGVAIAALTLGEQIPLSMVLALGFVVAGVFIARKASVPAAAKTTPA